MILFLDFDGVLHPQYEDQPVPSDVVFCHLTRFTWSLRGTAGSVIPTLLQTAFPSASQGG